MLQVMQTSLNTNKLSQLQNLMTFSVSCDVRSPSLSQFTVKIRTFSVVAVYNFSKGTGLLL